jgi:antitoxin (DNA-binding transcriptional repressor) of toxin-antitoxin stability system
MHNVEWNELPVQIRELLRRMRAGEHVLILHDGTPVARLVSVEPVRRPRVAGTGKGDFELAPDFVETPADVIDDFDGEGVG